MSDISRDLARSIESRRAASPEFLRMREESRRLLAAEQATEGPLAPDGSAPAPTAPPPTPPGEAKKSDWTFASEAYRVGVGAVRDVVQEFRDTVSEMSQYVDQNLFAIRDASGKQVGTMPNLAGDALRALKGASGVAPALPEVPQPQTVVGQVARPIAQFVLPFIGEMKMLGGVTAATKLGSAVKAAGVGASVDFAAFDPHDKRLSNLILEWTKGDPLFGKGVLDYLAAKDTDTAMEGRLKNVIEGLGIGAALEVPLFLAIKGYKKWKTAKGQDAASDIAKGLKDEPAPEAPKAAEENFDDAGKRAPAEGQTFADRVKAEADRHAADRAARLEAGEHRAPRTASPDETLPDHTPRAAEGEKAPRTPDADETPPHIDTVLREEVPVAREVPEEGAGKAPRTPDPETASTRLDEIVSNLEARGMRRAFMDPDNGRLILSNERPEGAALDLDTKVKAALETPAAARTAEDLVALRAMRQLQEAAAKALDVPLPTTGRVFSDADRAVARSPLIVPEGSKAALSDAERAAARAEGERAAATQAQRNVDTASKPDTPSGKTSASERAAREAAQEEASAILANAAALGKLAREGTPSGKILLEGGFASPTLLAHIAAAGAAGTYGFTSADSDASFGDRLARAGLFAAGALGVTVGAQKGAKTLAENAAAKSAAKAAEDELARKLASPAMEGIRPITAVERAMKATSKLPPADPALVTKMLDALAEGRLGEMAAMLKESHFNLERLDTPEQIDDLINAMTVGFEKDPNLPRHKAVGFAKIEELAKDVGARDLTGINLFKDTKNLAPRVLAMRTLLVSSAENVRAYARLAMDATLEGSDEAILAARRAITFHAALQARMKGVQTEVARALASFRITAGSSEFVASELRMMVDGLGGKDAQIAMLKKLALIEDPRALHTATRKGALARTASALYETWVNGILSGLGTHAANVVGNGMTVLFGTAEKTLAATFGMFRSGTDKHTLGEVLTQVQGMKDGLWDTLRLNAQGRGELAEAARKFATGDIHGAEAIIRDSTNMGDAYKAFATGQSQLDPLGTKLAMPNENALSSAGLGLTEESILGKFFDYLGATVVRAPAGKLLTTADEMFKASIYRGEMRATAYRQAMGEGLDGEALVKRVGELMDEPTDDMIEQAFEASRKGTFSQPLGEIGQKMQMLVNAAPPLKFIVPFIKTPLNIMGYAMERMPVTSLLHKQLWADLSAGGARRDMALAKLAVGHTIAFLAWDLKQQGLITGGGDKQKGAERLGGEQSYSFKVGNEWKSYARMEPFGTILGVFADMADISGHVGDREMGELSAMALTALSRNVVNKTYVKGFIDAALAISDGDKYGDRWVQQFWASWVPSWAANAARANDPSIKEVRSVADAVMARIPGMSERVPNHVNLLGEDVKMINGAGPESMSPFLSNYMALGNPVKSMKLSESPLAQEALRLNLDLRHPPRTMTVMDGAPGIDLSPQQYHRLMKLSGAIFKREGERLVQSQMYQNLPEAAGIGGGKYDGGRERAINLVFERAMRAGKMQLLQEDKSLQEKFNRVRQNVLLVNRGQSPLPLNDN